MKTRRKYLIFIALLAVVFIFIACAGILAVRAEEHSIGLTEPLAAKVRVGETVELPDYYAQSGSETVKAQKIIITPGGDVYGGTKFVASEPGLYTVEYTVNGAVVYSATCMAYIGSVDLISVNALAEVDGIHNYRYKSDDDAFKGVAVNVQSGGRITYEQEIDMSSLTKNDLLFEGIVEPKTQGDADFQQMVLTFTDVSDESVYFKTTITDGHADGNTPGSVVYINAGANGQTAGGLNYTAKGPEWTTTTIYGTNVTASFRAELYNGQSSNYSVKLYYDAAENALYTERGGTTLVADFDDPVIFASTAWSGFKSGKAKLTISFNEVKSNGGRVILNEIAGLRLIDEEIIDEDAPELTIDLFGQSKAPNALLGTEYTVFPYTVEDFFDQNVKVKVSVTHENSFTGAKTDISVVNGKFITNKLGRYTITYTATDYSGNRTEKSVSFDCITEADEIELKGIGADFSARAFERVEIPTLSQVRATGGNGDLKITVAAFDPDGEKIALNDFAFVPEKMGDYRIVYTATDYYGVTGEGVLKITVEANDETVFMNEIVMPELLISGFKYTVPEILAKTCSNGKVVNCVIDYFVNGTKLGTDRTFTASGTTAQIECRAYKEGSSGTYESIEKTVTILDGNSGANRAAYFYDKDGNITVTETNNNVTLSASTDGSVEFANKLRGASFNLEVNYSSFNARFSSFNITLSDAEDLTRTVTFKFEISLTGVKLTVPHGQAVNYPSLLGYFKFNFNCNTGIVTDASDERAASVLKDDAGNDFTGFANGLYAKFAFEEVRGTSSISFSSLNGQLFGTRSSGDEQPPSIELMGEIAVKARMGDTVTICPARAYDVLNQIKKVTVMVRRVGTPPVIVLATTSADVAHTLKLTERGTYQVIYYAYDSLDNEAYEIKTIRVVDSVAPTLSVEFANTVKSVGETVTLPNVSASDNSGTVKYDIFVTLPNNQMRLVLHSENGQITSYLNANDTHYPASFKASDNAFNLEMSGRYTLTVMAYDEDYNVTVQSFTILVK